MSKQQTAVEWLANELFKQLTGEPDKISLKEVLEQAKAMEKEQMIKFVNDYLDDDADLTAEQYYNETFKSE